MYLTSKDVFYERERERVNKPSQNINFSLKTVAVLFCLGFLFFGLAGKASAATYYVRADGTVTAANKANATNPNATSTALNMAQVNAASFLSGDQILFSSQGGNYTSVLTIPSGGSGVGSEITYGNVPDDTPVIAITSGNLIHTNSKSNIIIQGLTANYTGLSASTNMGIVIGTGSNILFRNITNNMGGFGYSVWSNSVLSDIVFDNVNLTTGTVSRTSIQLGGASNTNITLQNSALNTTGLTITNAINPTITNSTIAGVITIGTGSNVTINGITLIKGVTLNTVTTANVSNVTASNGSGFDFIASSGIVVNNSSMTGSTGYGAFTVGTFGGGSPSHDITYNRVTANNNSAHGFVAQDTSYNITYNNCTANNNENIGFLARASANNITYLYSEASYNGTVNDVFDGGGFLPHDNSNNIKIYYSIANHNFNQGFGDVSDGTGNAFYNIVNWHNGYAVGDVFNGTTVTTPSARGNVYHRKINAGAFIQNNGIFGGGKPREVLVTSPTRVTLDYNLYKPFDNNKFYSADTITDASWTTYHLTNELNSNNADPLFVNASGAFSTSTDFQLASLSPAIDAGTTGSWMTSTTTDFSGNPIYGTPDIGAYEYQPPFTIGTDDLDVTGNIRIYGDGKYRYTTATTSSATANLSVTPVDGFPTYSASTTRPEYLNISDITWGTSKQFTASSSIATSTIYTIGDLTPNTYYTVNYNHNNAGTTTLASLQADQDGKITFTYTGGYSTVVFDISPNPITTEPVTATPTNITHSSSGGSAQSQVNNLIAMGNYTLAREIAKQYGITIPSGTLPQTPTQQTPTNPSNPTTSFTRDLKLGMTGLDVKLLQQFLNTHGFPVSKKGVGSEGRENTRFGPATKAALIKFQKANKIVPAVGYFGAKTRSALAK